MVNKRAYKRIRVNVIDRNQLLEAALAGGNTGTVLGLDIAKKEIVGCVRWGTGVFERPWKIVNPKEIRILVELCLFLKSKCDGFSVALESTGTYGDAARYAFTQRTQPTISFLAISRPNTVPVFPPANAASSN